MRLRAGAGPQGEAGHEHTSVRGHVTSGVLAGQALRHSTPHAGSGTGTPTAPFSASRRGRDEVLPPLHTTLTAELRCVTKHAQLAARET
jgi:hypothetical protein